MPMPMIRTALLSPGRHVVVIATASTGIIQRGEEPAEAVELGAKTTEGKAINAEYINNILGHEDQLET